MPDHADARSWMPILPVLDDAPQLFGEGQNTCRVLNPRTGKTTDWSPARVHRYRDADGRLLG